MAAAARGPRPGVCQAIFLNRTCYWGITSSFGFVEQPQTNGVPERVNRTLKEQVVHVWIHRTVDELRVAVVAFVWRHNTQWRVEKLGFVTPTEARLRRALAAAA